MIIKRCIICLNWKFKNEFFKHKLKKDGYHKRCKNCETIRHENIIIFKN